MCKDKLTVVFDLFKKIGFKVYFPAPRDTVSGIGTYTPKIEVGPLYTLTFPRFEIITIRIINNLSKSAEPFQNRIFHATSLNLNLKRCSKRLLHVQAHTFT